MISVCSRGRQEIEVDDERSGNLIPLRGLFSVSLRSYSLPLRILLAWYHVVVETV